MAFKSVECLDLVAYEEVATQAPIVTEAVTSTEVSIADKQQSFVASVLDTTVDVCILCVALPTIAVFQCVWGSNHKPRKAI